MDLDRDAVAWNTADARAAAVNAPGWSDGLRVATFPGFPGGACAAVTDWLGDAAEASGALARGDSSTRPSASQGPLTSVALWGHVGTGKTGLGACALRALARAGVGSTFYWNMVTGPGLAAAVATGDVKRDPSPCWFESWPRLLAKQRRQSWDEESWFDVLEERVAALMLDDVGVDAGTPFRESFLLRHLEWAADRRGRLLLLTLNDRPDDWLRVFGDRVTDRLTDPRRFTVVHVGGASKR